MGTMESAGAGGPRRSGSQASLDNAPSLWSNGPEATPTQSVEVLHVPPESDDSSGGLSSNCFPIRTKERKKKSSGGGGQSVASDGDNRPASASPKLEEQSPKPPPLKDRVPKGSRLQEPPPAVDRRTKPQLVRSSTEEDGYEPVGRKLDEEQRSQEGPRDKEQPVTPTSLRSGKIYEDLDTPQASPPAASKVQHSNDEEWGSGWRRIPIKVEATRYQDEEGEESKVPQTSKDSKSEEKEKRNSKEQDKKLEKQRQKEERQQMEKEAKLKRKREKEEKAEMEKAAKLQRQQEKAEEKL